MAGLASPKHRARLRASDMLLILGAFSAMAVPAFWVLPAIDDFGAVQPIFHFSWHILLPGAEIGFRWLPFRNLLRLLTGEFPQYNLAIHHLTVILGHGLSAALVYYLAKRMGATVKVAAWACVIFLVTPAVAAAVWSLDSAIQTMSTAFGLAATAVYLLPKRRVAIAGWLALSAISVLWKESGIAWFLATPALGAMIRIHDLNSGGGSKTDAGRRIWKNMGLAWCYGILGIAIYFAVRFGLTHSLALGAKHGRYDLAIDPLIWARNLVMLLGVSTTTTDTLALFGHPSRIGLAVVSTVLGLPLLGITIYRVVKEWPIATWILAFVAVGLVAGPHLLLGHVSEMYAHPVVATLVIILAPLFNGFHERHSALLAVALGTFLMASVGVDFHKWRGIERTGMDARLVGERIAAQTIGARPKFVCTVINWKRRQIKGYSVFEFPAGPAATGGRAVWPLWGWKTPARIVVVSNRRDCPVESQAVWRISLSGAVRVYPGPASGAGPEG